MPHATLITMHPRRAIMVIGILLAGCSSPPREPLRVEIRDAAGQPAAGVWVRVLPRNPIHPLRPRDYLVKPADAGPSGRTGPDGGVDLDAPNDRPCNIVMLLPEIGSESLVFDAHPLSLGDTEWRPLPPGEGTPRFEARVVRIPR